MELHHLDWDSEQKAAPDMLVAIISGTSDKASFEARIREALDRGAYRKVAEIEGHDISDVFRLTQNIDESWAEQNHPGVLPIGNSPARSTSVGDVIIDDDGLVHAVASIGLITVSGSAASHG